MCAGGGWCVKEGVDAAAVAVVERVREMAARPMPRPFHVPADEVQCVWSEKFVMFHSGSLEECLSGDMREKAAVNVPLRTRHCRILVQAGMATMSGIE